MNAHKEVGLVSVGNVGTAVKRDEDIGLTIEELKNKEIKKNNWEVAIGLNKVDGLVPSDYDLSSVCQCTSLP